MATPASSDEGEIVENGVGDSKATSLSHIEGTGVDRVDRNRARYSRSRSPEYVNGSRYPLSSRQSHSPRGHKRLRDDRDSYRGGRLDTDPRRFRVHYEDSADSQRRLRLPYDDEDRPPSRSSASDLHYDDRDRDFTTHNRGGDRSRDRDRHPRKRHRNRTRSPYRPPPRNEKNRNGHSRRDDNKSQRAPDRDGTDSARPSHQGTPRHSQDQAKYTQRQPLVETFDTGKDKTKRSPGSSNETTATAASTRLNEPDKDYEEKPVDIEAEIERRRRRREELLAKSRGATPMLVQVLQASEKTNASSPSHTRASTPMATEGTTPRSSK